MKKTLITLTISCLALFASAQQSWQWAKIGGSNSSGSVNNPIDEWVVSMASDPNGNTYALVSGANKIRVDQDTSKFNGKAFSIVSFACDGRVRWIKSLGQAASAPGEIGTDTLGGVYLIGRMHLISGTYIDTDTVIAPSSAYKWNYIIKYDTSGNLKWTRFPDSSLAIASFSNWPAFTHLQVSPGGDLHIMAYLSPGLHGNGTYAVTDNAYHVLKYNKDGDFTGGVRLPVSVPIFGGNQPRTAAVEAARFLRDHNSGRYYLAGSILPPYTYLNLFIGSDTVRTNGRGTAMYVASFDRGGSLKWFKQQDTADVGGVSGATLDRNGKLYISGHMGNGSRWNGATFTAPSLSIPVLSMAYAACMDSNGVNKWTSSGASPDGETPFAACIAVNKDNVVRVSGAMYNKFTWGNFRLSKARPTGATTSNAGFYLATLDAVTGVCTAMDSARSKYGYTAYPAFMNTDRNGNFIIGGHLGNEFTIVDTLITIGTTKLTAIGGNKDFFVTKYGVPGCTQPVTSSISTIGVNDLQVFPNPATETITIIGIKEKVNYTLFDNMGRKAAAGQLTVGRSSVNIAVLIPGLYFLQLQGDDHSRTVFKIFKQ